MAEAQLGRTELDVKRFTPLAMYNAISQEELDDAVQSNLAAKASVAMRQAAVQQAQLNLEFASITSPIDGIAGLARAQIGDLVGPGSGNLTRFRPWIRSKPISPSTNNTTWTTWRHSRAGDGTGGGGMELELVLANGAVHP